MICCNPIDICLVISPINPPNCCHRLHVLVVFLSMQWLILMLEFAPAIMLIIVDSPWYWLWLLLIHLDIDSDHAIFELLIALIKGNLSHIFSMSIICPSLMPAWIRWALLIFLSTKIIFWFGGHGVMYSHICISCCLSKCTNISMHNSERTSSHPN